MGAIFDYMTGSFLIGLYVCLAIVNPGKMFNQPFWMWLLSLSGSIWVFIIVIATRQILAGVPDDI